eukprot:CAMPEP_0182418834 /NCGR_PEP_ID=MMETSP1167-20130531/3215_1 /TAXON_ID=2988 /ORGANISM="Mallomonas Sp, Strain CCMP3275" /LENGTH=437 /DNA_ID=CAMNT_0024593263 /DNA_START=1987 /DNA_END=3300 /DNA_ORIENTATION=-
MTNMQAKAILDRYDTNSEGRLTLEGFLRRYADVAMYNPKSVWQDLMYFGYQNDLKRVKDATVVGSSITNTGATNTVTAPLSLPEGSRQCLMDLVFYEAGLDAAEGATIAIAKRVCTGDDMTSNLLLKQALSELFRTVKEWVWSPSVEMILGFIRVIINVHDQYISMRMEQLMTGEFGLLKVIISESRNPSVLVERRGSTYDEYDSSRSISSRYLDFIQDLRNISDIVSTWINEQAVTNADYKWLKQQLQPVQAKATSIDEDADLQRITVIVEGAGTVECNGVYHYKKMADNAALFQKAAVYENNSVVFNLYRCRMNDNTHRWFISITPNNRDPGTDADVDFYSATSSNDRIYTSDDRMPPKNKWIKCKGEFVLEPCPVVSWRNRSVSPATSDDHDETLAGVDDDVNDDSYSSLPGTPGAEGDTSESANIDHIPFASI